MTSLKKNKRRIFCTFRFQTITHFVLPIINEPHESFDLIEGGIADEDVFNTLDLYMDNLIDKDETIHRLKKKRPNWQICFCNQKLIDTNLHFLEAIKLESK